MAEKKVAEEAVVEKKTRAKKAADTAEASEKKTAKKTTAKKTAEKTETAAKAKKAEAVEEKKLTVTLTRGFSGKLKTQIAVAKSLGLRRIGDVSVQPDNSATRGKIAKISHMVSVKEN